MDFKKLAPVIAALIILCAAIAMFFLSYNSQDINPPKTSFITPIPSLISPTPNNEQETAMYKQQIDSQLLVGGSIRPLKNK